MQLCCSPRRLQLFTVFLAAVTIVTVLIILFLHNYPTFARRRVIETVVFRDGTEEMSRFKTTEELVNLRVSFNVFTITNPEEVINGTAQMRVKEIGPFVYHELKTKEFTDNNQTSGLITFKLRKRYTFLPKLSVGDPKTMNITWPNIPIIAARSFIDQLSFIKRNMAYGLFNNFISVMNEPAFMTDTVENFIFSGSKRVLFERLQQVGIGQLFKPWPLKDNKFAVMYDRNDTWYPERDHVFTVAAGFGLNQTVKDLNQYVYMNQSAILPYWQNETCNNQSSGGCQLGTCNKLEGTDGQFFAPFLNSSENLKVYAIDICRKLELKYRTTEMISGVAAYKYSLAETSLQSGVTHPPNACYCLDRDPTNGTLGDSCKINGLIDLSSCVAPNVFASGSHFLYGDKELSTRILGIRPANASIDEPYAYVEPNVGVTLQVKVPLQLNIRLQKGGFKLFDFFQDDKPLVIPLLVATEAAELTDAQASLLRSKLLLLDLWLVTVVLGGSIVFILAIIATVVVMCLRYRRSPTVLVAAADQAAETDPLIADGVSTNSQHSHTSAHQRSSSYQAI